MSKLNKDLILFQQINWNNKKKAFMLSIDNIDVCVVIINKSQLKDIE